MEDRPTPLYLLSDLRTPAYQLRYSWTAWLSQSESRQIPNLDIRQTLGDAWERDGIRCLEVSWAESAMQILVSAEPHVSPVTIAARLKGRLAHQLRQEGFRNVFRRKFALRSVGENQSAAIENYISAQISKGRFVDPKFAELLERFTRVYDIDWGQPTRMKRGCYWYDLHLVLFTEERLSFTDSNTFELLDQYCSKIATARGHNLGGQSIMPDHIHLALRANPLLSPDAIALSFLNNLAYGLGQKRVWKDGYYAGTFSEYDMGAIRYGLKKQRP